MSSTRALPSVATAVGSPKRPTLSLRSTRAFSVVCTPSSGRAWTALAPKLRVNGSSVRNGVWSNPAAVASSLVRGTMSRSDSSSGVAVWYDRCRFDRVSRRIDSRSTSPCAAVRPPSVAIRSDASSVAARKRRRSTMFTTRASAR